MTDLSTKIESVMPSVDALLAHFGDSPRAWIEVFDLISHRHAADTGETVADLIACILQAKGRPMEPTGHGPNGPVFTIRDLKMAIGLNDLTVDEQSDLRDDIIGPRSGTDVQ